MPGNDWTSRPAGSLRGEVMVPGDKSISHRALMLASLADGVTRVEGCLDSEDTRATASIFRAMGAHVEFCGPSRCMVDGLGLHGLERPLNFLDCGNSGTCMRLLSGILSGQGFDSTLIGDESLSCRPMRRVVEPLRGMGAEIEADPGDLPPLRIRGARQLRGIDYLAPVASAQVKSAILLAGMYAEGETRIHEPTPTRDHTERMLAAFGWPISMDEGRVSLSGGHRLRATSIEVPRDFSSAAFFIVAATLNPGSDLTLRGVGVNPRRIGLLDVLGRMGADIHIENRRQCGVEPVADIRVRHAALHGITIQPDRAVDMIDEFPILFIAAGAAHGRTTIRGVGELRVKESDRIDVMCTGLRELGIVASETPDGAVIDGGRFAGGSVTSARDHRCAMSLAVAGLIAGAPVTVGDCANVATSFPGFFDMANECGFALSYSVD